MQLINYIAVVLICIMLSHQAGLKEIMLFSSLTQDVLMDGKTKAGYSRLQMISIQKNNRSENLHIDGNVRPSYVFRSFCVKTTLGEGDNWPQGNYSHVSLFCSVPCCSVFVSFFLFCSFLKRFNQFSYVIYISFRKILYLQKKKHPSDGNEIRMD